MFPLHFFSFFSSHFYFLLGLCVCLFTSSSNLGVPSSGVETEWGVVPAVVPQWTRLPWSLTCSRPWLTQPGTCSTIPGPGPYVCVSCALVHNRHCRFSCSTTSTVCFPQLALSVFLCFFFLFSFFPIATSNACLPVHVSTASNVCFPVFTIKLSVSCPCALVHSQVVRFPVHLSTTSTVFLSTCPQPALSVSLCTCPQPALSVWLCTCPQPALSVSLSTCPQPALSDCALVHNQHCLFSCALVHNQHCLYLCELVNNQHCLFGCALVHNQHCLFPYALVHNHNCFYLHLSTTSNVFSSALSVALTVHTFIQY